MAALHMFALPTADNFIEYIRFLRRSSHVHFIEFVLVFIFSETFYFRAVSMFAASVSILVLLFSNPLCFCLSSGLGVRPHLFSCVAVLPSALLRFFAFLRRRSNSTLQL